MYLCSVCSLFFFAFITTRLQCNPDAASRLADEHALIATFVNRLQSGARSVLGRSCWSGGGAITLFPLGVTFQSKVFGLGQQTEGNILSVL